MAHFLSSGQATNLVEVRIGAQANVQLWGDGPGGIRLEVTSSDPSIVRVEEIPASIGANLRGFTFRGLRQGSARVLARAGAGGPIWADTRVLVGANAYSRYYHGTKSAFADLITRDDLTPHLLSTILVAQFEWSDYTDFGKGFYVHEEANKAMAYEWAKREFKADWAVVEFIATADELSNLPLTALRFENKMDRPYNSPRAVSVTSATVSAEFCPIPQLLPCLRVSEQIKVRRTSGTTMSWLDFVEYNRHIDRRRPMIARPNDRDWTSTYCSISGPFWVPRDSGYNTGHPIFPDDLHQVNWGLDGMAMLNGADAKARRFKFSADNEGIFPPPV